MPLQSSAPPRGFRNLSIAFIALLILSVALWLVFSNNETPTGNDTSTKTAGNASAPAPKSIQSDTQSVASQKSTQSDTQSVASQNSTQSDTQSVAPQNSTQPDTQPVASASTQSDTQSVAPEQSSTQQAMQSARTDSERPLQSTKNDVESKMCQVADRDFYNLSGVVAVSRGQTDSEQVPVDDKLTAEEVFAGVGKYPSVRFMIDVPISGFRFYDGQHITVGPSHPLIDAQKLSQSERVRLCGLRRIQRMATLTLYNNHCGDRPLDDNAAAAAIIESQFKKLPRDVQEKTLGYQLKAIDANPGGWRWFCDGVNDDIKEGNADSMFMTAREGFFPIGGN